MTDKVVYLTSPAGVHVAVPASQLPYWERLGYVRRGPGGQVTPTDE